MPTVCVDSGNGLQFLWRLKTPLSPGKYLEKDWVNGSTGKRVEALNKALTIKLGSKAGTQNVDRLLRLPGTINHPNKAKRDAGREPCMATQLWFGNESYELDDFVAFETIVPEAEDGRLHAQEEEEDDLSKNLENVIKHGRYELFPDKNGEPDRSRAVWWVANEMQRRGYAQSAMMSVLLDKANRISEHVYDQGDMNAARRYAAKQISNAWIQLGDDLPRIRSIEFALDRSRHSRCRLAAGQLWSMPRP